MSRRNRNQEGVVTTDSLADETTEEREQREEREREEAARRNKEASEYDDPELEHRQRNLYGQLDTPEFRERNKKK